MTLNWRHVLLAGLALGTFALLFALAPVPQNPAYHAFADTGFLNVASNAAFLLVGAVGLAVCLTKDVGIAKASWLVFFVGVISVGVGSAYYHWQPSNSTLVWDRLPMTVGFMGLFAAVIGESVDERLGRVILVPAIAVGVLSVLWWVLRDDLRFYGWVQFVPLATILVVLGLFDAKYSHRGLIGVGLGWYALAKVFEYFDVGIFEMTGGGVSGHTLKHLSAAAGCATIVWMLKARRL